MKPSAEDTPRRLDLDSWSRREHFSFFRGFDLPFWNVTAEVDVTDLHARSNRPEGPSFTIAAFYLSLRAVNEVEAMRMRIRPGADGDDVVVLPRVHGGTTVLRDDDTFGFGYFDFDPGFEAFAADAARAIEAAKQGREFLPGDRRDDLVYYSVLPWISFTSFQHARKLGTDDSVPRIVFGRHRDQEGRRTMPVSVEAHHALVDGLHVGRFFARFQAGLDDLPASLT